MAITTIDGWTLTEIYTICGFKSGLNVFALDEVQDFALNNTEETKNITGAGGSILNTRKTNKQVKGSGTNGLLSGGLMSMQTGSDEKVTDIVIKFHDTAKATTADTYTLQLTPSGTAGSEVGYIIKTDKTTGAKTKLTQAITATTGKFSVSGTTVTFNTGEVAIGDTIDCYYNTELSDNTAVCMTNSGDKFSDEAEVVVEGMAKDGCGTEAKFQIIIPRADFVGNWDLTVGDNQTVHKFEFTSLKNKCSTSKKFWDFIIFNDPTAA